MLAAFGRQWRGGVTLDRFFPVTLYMRCDGNLRGLYKKKIETTDMERNGLKKIKSSLK